MSEKVTKYLMFAAIAGAIGLLSQAVLALKQLPGAGPKLTRQTQASPAEAKAAQEAARGPYKGPVEVQGEKSGDACLWLYEKGLDAAIKIDSNYGGVTSSGTRGNAFNEVQAWAMLYTACRGRYQR